MLPGEERANRLIQSRQSNDLEAARTLLQLGCRAHSSLIDIQTTGLGDLVKCVTLGLYTKACKQYRSAIALCQLGLTEDADVIARTQFESILALQFVLKARVSLRRHRMNLPALPANCPAREFRAKLYVAHQCFRPCKLIDDMEMTARLKRGFKKSTKVIVRKDAADWEKVIGPWHNVLKSHPYTYSGLSIAKLSKALGFEKWYRAVYGIQSSRIHGSDALDFIEGKGNTIYAKLEPDASGVPMRLRFSCLLFGISTDIVNTQFRLGFDSEVDNHRDRIDKMARDSS